MKTTIEIKDELFREAKATAAREGVTLRQLIEEAVQERLARVPIKERLKQGWRVPPPDVPRAELRRIQRLIDEEFE